MGGKGGIFTHSMLLAIDKLDNFGRVEYSAGTLYKATVKEDNEIFHSKQDITINASPQGDPDNMAWPLIPHDYVAPLNGAMQAISGGEPIDLSDGADPADFQHTFKACLIIRTFSTSTILTLQLCRCSCTGPRSSFLNSRARAWESTRETPSEFWMERRSS